jgi:hypothetical protein
MNDAPERMKFRIERAATVHQMRAMDELVRPTAAQPDRASRGVHGHAAAMSAIARSAIGYLSYSGSHLS